MRDLLLGIELVEQNWLRSYFLVAFSGHFFSFACFSLLFFLSVSDALKWGDRSGIPEIKVDSEGKGGRKTERKERV